MVTLAGHCPLVPGGPRRAGGPAGGGGGGAGLLEGTAVMIGVIGVELKGGTSAAGKS